MPRKKSGATYIASDHITRKASGGVARWFISASAALLALFLVFTTLSIVPQTAWADEDQSAEESEAARSETISQISETMPDIPEDERDDWFMDQVKWRTKNANATVADFAGVVWSLFGIRYINEVPRAATVPSNAAAQAQLGIPTADGNICSTNAKGAGTAYYHNCDIPNVMTEFLQGMFSIVDQDGVQGALPSSAKTNLGVPKNLPGTGVVPSNPDHRGSKYTALELYGYDLPWTTYLGEWDNVKTMTEARMMSNFGFFDHVGLTGAAIGQGILNGLTVGVDNFNNVIGNGGNLFEAIASAWGGFVVGATSGGIATILDTSDLNVVASFAWYRVGYSSTAYGIRGLTNAEIAAQARLVYLQMLTSTAPPPADLPDDLVSIAPGGEKPRAAISKCEVLSVNLSDGGDASVGSWSERGAPTASQMEDPDYTGLTQAECIDEATSSYNRWINADNYEDKGPNGESYTSRAQFTRWEEDGNRLADTVAMWKELNAEMFSIAASYDIDCSATYPNNSDPAREIHTAFLECWGGGSNTGYTGGRPPGSVEENRAWNAAANKIYEETQSTNNQNWVLDIFSQKAMQEFIQADQEKMNFNAPWNRYICLNEDGSDMTVTNSGITTFVYAFDYDGNFNSACAVSEVRAPIQNGLFGNGYTGVGSTQQPANDTRHISNFGDPMGVLVSGIGNSLATSMQTGLLKIGQLATSISSEIITWSYMPILDSLGITDIIVNLIEGFRDTLFYPLSIMVIAAAGIYVLWRAFRHQAYRESFTSVLLIILVYVTGALLMERTQEVVDFTQDVPAMAEEAIIGTIFSASNLSNDQLCTSTFGAVSTSNNVFGRMADTSASEATRELVCNNWRTFTFTPWVYGQFGSGFENHYANGAVNVPSGGSTWTNTNSNLVGQAGVNMGGGEVVQNWALYQLELTKTGTVTEQEVHYDTLRTDPNIYRIVDAQFGPNNGAGTETRYAEAWAGQDQANRWMIAFMSTGLAIFGAIVVGAYALTKLVISTLVTLMLVFLPFALLIGLFPSKRGKLKDYSLTIVGMMIQRVVLTLVLAIFFLVLMSFANAAQGNYFNIFFIGLLVCILFWLYRKDIQEFIFSSIGNPSFGSAWRNDPKNALKEWPIARTMVQRYEQVKEARTAVGAAIIGSVAAGRNPFASIDESGKRVWNGGLVAKELKSRARILDRKQLREGHDGLYSGFKSAMKVHNETKSGEKLDETTKEIIKEIFEPSAEKLGAEEYDKHTAAFNTLAATPGYTLQSELVFKDGYAVYDENGEQKVQQYITEDETGIRVAELREYDKLGFENLSSAQDRRLAVRYGELEETAIHLRAKLSNERQKMLKEISMDMRGAYEKNASVFALPSLQAYTQEEDLVAKKRMAKTLRKDIQGDLESVFANIDSELSDELGYTDGDRRKVKNALKKFAMISLEQETNEHEMLRIRTHLEKVARYEARGSSSVETTKQSIKNMERVIAEAAKKNAKPESETIELDDRTNEEAKE